MKTFIVEYERATGGYRDHQAIYYIAERPHEILRDFLEDFGYEKVNIDKILEDYNDNATTIKIPGEWQDEISRGGDFIYYDLNIYPTNEIFGEVKIPLSLLEKSDQEIASYVKLSINKPYIFTITKD